MSTVSPPVSPATALLRAASSGLTFRELMTACYGATPNAAQRHDLLRELDEFERDGKVRFSQGTDRFYWQGRISSMAPVRREQEGAGSVPTATSPRPAPPLSRRLEARAPTSELREAIRKLIVTSGRPMKSREIVDALADRWPEAAVFTWLSRMRNVGDLRQDERGGPYRTPGMMP